MYTRPLRPLTNRQASILEFIMDHIEENGFPPTYRAIGAHFGINSTNGVSDHLICLERKGYISRSGIGESREMCVLKSPGDTKVKLVFVEDTGE